VQGNMGKMMKQIQKMQNDMLRMQEEIKSRTLEASSGGGVVRVVVNGQKEVESLFIDPQAVDPEDLEMLQDMVVAAVNEGLRKVEEMIAEEMKKITGGMNLPPGLF
jgi:nucleoid-associated protein EbfC